MLTIRSGADMNVGKQDMIQGIDNYSNSIMNAYRVQNNPGDATLRKLNSQAEDQAQEKKAEAASPSIDLRLDDIRPRQNASLEDISLSLNEPKAFEMKGKDADITSLDMEKAISDMQKDQALMQYQYFVGETNVSADEDGIVIAK